MQFLLIKKKKNPVYPTNKAFGNGPNAITEYSDYQSRQSGSENYNQQKH